MKKHLLIFALSIGVVVTTQIVAMNVSASESGDSSQTNQYLSLINSDGNFKFAGEDCSEPLFTPGDDEIDKITKTYHAQINCRFNLKIKRMRALGKTGKKEDLEALITLLDPPPPIIEAETGAQTGRKSCDGAENLSTYCLAMDATKEFSDFRDALTVVRRKIKTEVGSRSPTQTGGGMSQAQRNLVAENQKANRIDNEITIAQKALDEGLAAYNELQMALPLHMKYQALIEALEGYRDKISAIRKQVDLYPTTFLNVSTTKCT